MHLNDDGYYFEVVPNDQLTFVWKGTGASQELYPFSQSRSGGAVYGLFAGGTPPYEIAASTTLTISSSAPAGVYPIRYKSEVTEPVTGCIEVTETGGGNRVVYAYDDFFGDEVFVEGLMKLYWKGTGTQQVITFLDRYDQEVCLFGGNDPHYTLTNSADGNNFTVSPSVDPGIYRIKYGGKGAVKGTINVKKLT